jgi:predicted nucleic acid-binding protein
MTLLLDTSLWIDFTRDRSPAAQKHFIAPFVLDHEAHLAEPVTFEVLRSARPEEARLLEAQFATLPTLPTPAGLAQGHNAVLVSFDADFEAIASVSELHLRRLRRPT